MRCVRFYAALSGKDTTSGVPSRFRAVLAAVRNSGFGELPRVDSGLQVKGWRQIASHSTADRQSRPHFRAFQNLTIGVKMKVGEKSWSQIIQKTRKTAGIREILMESPPLK
jgi:hypothetical protein